MVRALQDLHCMLSSVHYYLYIYIYLCILFMHFENKTFLL